MHVREAKGLKNTDIIGKSDPYVVLCILDQRKQTRVIDDNLDPVFDETFDFDIVDPTTQVIRLVHNQFYNVYNLLALMIP